MLTDASRKRSARRTSGEPNEGVSIEVTDVLVFEYVRGGFELVSGRGRGAGWAGIVRVEEGDDSLVCTAWRRGTAQHVAGTRPQAIVGPYYARNAVALPVGERHVVVFGDDRPLRGQTAELMRQAAVAVDETHGVPADKLLADELELVEALRTLMAYRPETVPDTLRHIANVAARALSCEVALVHIERNGMTWTEGVLDGRAEAPLGRDARRHLVDGMQASSPILEQVATTDPDIFGIEVAARMTLPVGEHPAIGAIALGHATTRARGFTSLCQRIGRAIAEAAELLVSQAQAREELSRERDLMRGLSATDALTGLPNRRAFEGLCQEIADSSEEIHVLSCDVDDLKSINDRYGHDAGDTVLRAVANMLRDCVRSTDVVCRLGGDEFAVFLRASAADTKRIVARIRRAESAWQVTEHSLKPCVSIGAVGVERDLAGALRIADRRMYADKRRRKAGRPDPSGPDPRPVLGRRVRPR